MPNEDVITALKNAIEHGDSLESAKQIMINSGYNPREVEEASKFVGGGVIRTQQPQPGEQLTMPSKKKKIFGFLKKKKQPPLQQPPQQTQPPTQLKPLQRGPVSPQQLKQEITSQQTPRTVQQVNQQPQVPKRIQVPSLNPSQVSQSPPIQNQLQQIKPSKPGHMKEIILLVLLLALIGILITTIVLKDTILGWFS